MGQQCAQFPVVGWDTSMNKVDVDLALAELVHWYLTPGCSSHCNISDSGSEKTDGE